MDNKAKEIVREAIVKIIQDVVSETNVQKSRKLHDEKIHFIPVQYRVLGGLIQSLNIRFGNFIEKLIALVVESD